MSVCFLKLKFTNLYSQKKLYNSINMFCTLKNKNNCARKSTKINKWCKQIFYWKKIKRKCLDFFLGKHFKGHENPFRWALRSDCTKIIYFEKVFKLIPFSFLHCFTFQSLFATLIVFILSSLGIFSSGGLGSGWMWSLMISCPP